MCHRRSFGTLLRTTQLTPYAQAQAGADVVNFALGQPSPSILAAQSEQLGAAAAARLGAGEDPFALQYGAGQGSAPFREALAAFLTREHGGGGGAGAPPPVRADDLFITNGNSSALDMLCGLVLRRRADAEPPLVLAEHPTYFLAGPVFRDHGATVERLGMTSDGVDIGALRAQAAGGRAALAYLQPNFHNPTGRSLSAAKRAAVRAVASDTGTTVVADEPYNLLRFDAREPAAPSLATGAASAATPALRGSVLALGSFSKILAPGLRLGWVHAPRPAIDALCSVGHVRSGGGSSPVTSALVQHMLETGALDASLLTLRGTLRERCEALCAELDVQLGPLGFEFEPPTGGYFVWLGLPIGLDLAKFEAAAAECGVAFTAGHRCSATDEPADNTVDRHIRLSFAFYEPEELAMGVQRLRQAAARSM